MLINVKWNFRLFLVKCFDNKMAKSPFNCVTFPLTQPQKANQQKKREKRDILFKQFKHFANYLKRPKSLIQIDCRTYKKEFKKENTFSLRIDFLFRGFFVDNSRWLVRLLCWRVWEKSYDHLSSFVWIFFLRPLFFF